MTIEKELEKLYKKRSLMRMKHMQRYRDGTATRAKTTTHNANVSMINDEIEFLKSELKKEPKR